MRIPRIYHPENLLVDTDIELSADATNHIANVLRLKIGHPIVLFNGDGNEYSAELVEVQKRKVVAQVDAKLGISVESPLSIHLGQGISRGDRMDLVLQKSTELGVTEITPLLTARCGVKLDQQRWQKKYQQWQKILISACEQCGRNSLPLLHPPTSIDDWLRQSTQQLRLTLNPRAEAQLRQLNIPKEGVRLLIGPEGGLTEQEVYLGEENGFNSIKMGPRILRTETAAIAVISALQAQFGDL